MFPRSSGYVLEALIEPQLIGSSKTAVSGGLGFGLGVHVSDDGSHPELVDSDCDGQSTRLGQYYMRLGPPIGECRGDPWCNTQAFCTPELLSAN